MGVVYSHVIYSWLTSLALGTRIGTLVPSSLCTFSIHPIFLSWHISTETEPISGILYWSRDWANNRNFVLLYGYHQSLPAFWYTPHWIWGNVRPVLAESCFFRNITVVPYYYRNNRNMQSTLMYTMIWAWEEILISTIMHHPHTTGCWEGNSVHMHSVM